jgi:hypothetical protein
MKLKNIATLGLVGLIGLASPVFAKANDKTAKTEKFYNGGEYKEGQLIYFNAQHDDYMEVWRDWMSHPMWCVYSNGKNKSKPKFNFSNIPGPENTGTRINYYMPKDTHLGIYNVLDFDVSGFDGIKFLAKASGKFKVVMTEGHSDKTNAYLGEVYEITIEPEYKWVEYTIPFNKLERAKFQHSEKEMKSEIHTFLDPSLFDFKLNLDKIHSPAFEFLCDDENMDFLEVKNVSFYKNHGENKKLGK